jgi:SsrA-binding protein
MTNAKKNKASSEGTIAVNRKASFDYQLLDRYEAGLVLAGWEVKAIRSGKAQISDSYVILKKEEAYWLGGVISPLSTVSTHIIPDPARSRKLLLKRSELKKLLGAVERKGFTLVPTKMYWKGRTVKLEFAVAEGKKKHDKRADIKDKDWQRDKQRLLTSKLMRSN